MEEVNLRVVIE